MIKALWRAVPLLLLVAVVWWGADRAVVLFRGDIEDSAGQRVDRLLDLADDKLSAGETTSVVGEEREVAGSALTESLEALRRAVSVKDLVVLVALIVGVVWLVKWLRHRSLMRFLRDAAERKQSLEQHLVQAREQTQAKVEAARVRHRGEAATPQRAPAPSLDERSLVVLGEAHALLASHLATQLALQGAMASPDRTVRLLRKAGASLQERLLSQRERLDDAYDAAVQLGHEVRRLITGTPRYLSDPQTQRVADALVEVIRVLESGEEGSWACDTIEGFVLGVQDVKQAEKGSRKFANDHGPMARAFGAVTSRRLRKPPLPTGDTDEQPLTPRATREGGGEVTSTFLQRAKERQRRSRRD